MFDSRVKTSDFLFESAKNNINIKTFISVQYQHYNDESEKKCEDDELGNS